MDKTRLEESVEILTNLEKVAKNSSGFSDAERAALADRQARVSKILFNDSMHRADQLIDEVDGL